MGCFLLDDWVESQAADTQEVQMSKGLASLSIRRAVWVWFSSKALTWLPSHQLVNNFKSGRKIVTDQCLNERKISAMIL